MMEQPGRLQANRLEAQELNNSQFLTVINLMHTFQRNGEIDRVSPALWRIKTLICITAETKLGQLISTQKSYFVLPSNRVFKCPSQFFLHSLKETSHCSYATRNIVQHPLANQITALELTIT